MVPHSLPHVHTKLCGHLERLIPIVKPFSLELKRRIVVLDEQPLLCQLLKISENFFQVPRYPQLIPLECH